MLNSRASRAPLLGKLSPPRLGRVIGRDRLFGEIDQWAGAPGLWIAGPPGIGKTTLVASYLDARALPCLWLQLDAGDVDPATFVHFLRAAAARQAPRRKLRLPAPSADDLRDVPGFIRRCFRRLALTLERPWVLVLDNLQELGPAPLLHAGMAAALAELPEQARLIIISREPPGPPYARALAGQQLALLEAPALRFNDDETGRLVHLHERDWPPAALRQATDGWAAAMILLLAARRDLDPDAAMHGGAARERLFAFFAGEVMQKMAPSDALALMRIAFLPSATAAMAVAISGDAGAATLLADLARRSLFTDRRAGTPPAYTFHALFGEFLRARAADQLDGQALRLLRVQAAQILLAHGQADAAMLQLIDAAAWDEALALLVAQAGAFVAQGRTATVQGWILALPQALRDGPQASYWLGYCALASQPADALRHLERAHTGFTAQGDRLGAFYTAAAAADAIIFLGANLDALAPWMPWLESYAPLYLASRDVESDLRVLPGLLAAFVHRETAHPLTAPLADLAERLLDQALAASQRVLLGSLAFYLLWTGQTVRLDRIMIKIDRMCSGQEVAPATLFRWYGVGVLIRSLLGRIDEALDYARRALALASPGPAPMRAKAHLLMVLAALAARDGELARTHLHETASVLDAGNPIDTTTYEFQRGLLMMLDGDWRSAAQLMRAAVASGRTSGWPLREHIALLGQTLALTRVGAFDEAQSSLRAVLVHPFYAVCRWHQYLAALIEAFLAEQQDDPPRCLGALGRAFAIGRECGYDFGPMPYCCGDMMSRLAALALAHDLDVPFVKQIVRRYALPAPAGAGEHWPWPIRIRTLGHFSVEREGEAAKSSRKESRKPLDLLKLLLALGGEAVPVARLCAALWPEAQGDAARNSFDNALHRLRKLLGGDHFVQLLAGGLSLDRATCWNDVAALQTCLAQMDTLAPEHDAARLALLLEQALALYQGEFLVGEDELPDVLVARERIQARFTRQMGAQGARLEAAGQLAAAVRLYRRVVEQQPLAEDIYRRLITSLLALGQRAEAYEVYRRCRQQLSVLLGLRPAPETEALVTSLRNL
jgi:DNA-binding SARP family transcriptional activator